MDDWNERWVVPAAGRDSVSEFYASAPTLWDKVGTALLAITILALLVGAWWLLLRLTGNREGTQRRLWRWNRYAERQLDLDELDYLQRQIRRKVLERELRTLDQNPEREA